MASAVGAVTAGPANRSDTATSSALTMASKSHPAKHLRRILPSSPSVTLRLGVASAWAGQRAVQPVRDFRTRSKRESSASIFIGFEEERRRYPHLCDPIFSFGLAFQAVSFFPSREKRGWVTGGCDSRSARRASPTIPVSYPFKRHPGAHS